MPLPSDSGGDKTTKMGICVYCGRSGGITRDHAPPQGFLASPMPSKLITVPCCLECQRTNDENDDNCLKVLRIGESVPRYPGGEDLQGKALRGLQKHEKSHAVKDLARSMRTVDCCSPTALFLGKKTAYPMDAGRLACWRLILSARGPGAAISVPWARLEPWFPRFRS